jgi:hypothetical protein
LNSNLLTSTVVSKIILLSKKLKNSSLSVTALTKSGKDKYFFELIENPTIEDPVISIILKK